MHIREHVEKEWVKGGGWGGGPQGRGITSIKQRAADLITRLGNAQRKIDCYFGPAIVMEILKLMYLFL